MTPTAIPGAVSMSLEAQGELTPFFADGVKYWVASSNGGYEGDLEIAMITDQFREEILKEAKDANGVLFEDANAQTEEFALGFELDGDKNPILFWFFNCTATRPKVDAKTTDNNKDPNTDTLKISCAANAQGFVRAKTTDESYAKVKDAWFTKVYEKATVVAA